MATFIKNKLLVNAVNYMLIKVIVIKTFYNKARKIYLHYSYYKLINIDLLITTYYI